VDRPRLPNHPAMRIRPAPQRGYPICQSRDVACTWSICSMGPRASPRLRGSAGTQGSPACSGGPPRPPRGPRSPPRSHLGRRRGPLDGITRGDRLLQLPIVGGEQGIGITFPSKHCKHRHGSFFGSHQLPIACRRCWVAQALLEARRKPVGLSADELPGQPPQAISLRAGRRSGHHLMAANLPTGTDATTASDAASDLERAPPRRVASRPHVIRRDRSCRLMGRLSGQRFRLARTHHGPRPRRSAAPAVDPATTTTP
jgi:hypothetical protein